MKKNLLIAAMLVIAAGVGFNALGGLTWIDSLGLRGQDRVVLTRINAYWDARVEGDMEAMADFVHPLQQEIMQPGMLITEGYEIKDLHVEGDTAEALIAVKSRLKHPQMSSRIREHDMKTQWVRYEGKWYRELLPTDIHGAIKYHRGEWTPPTAADPSAAQD